MRGTTTTGAAAHLNILARTESLGLSGLSSGQAIGIGALTTNGSFAYIHSCLRE